MVRKAEQINKKTIKALTQAMEELGHKYSIRVGIQGDKAFSTHKDTNLTNAQLGAIHEFGAVINVTDKMRAFLHSQGIHLKASTNQIIISARSFLRDTLLSNEGKERLMDYIGLSSDNTELNVEVLKLGLMKDSGFMDKLANALGAKALEMVQEAFYIGGYPNSWKPVSKITTARRKNDKSSPPLTDSGELRDSITAEVKKIG